MAKCLNVDCNNEVVSQEGKRQKKTCSDSCRQKVWQNNKKDSKYVRVLRIEWEKIVNERKNAPPLPLMGMIRNSPNGKEEVETEFIPLEIIPFFSKKDIKEKEFRPRRDDESGMEYRIALEEWRINNQ